MTALVLALLAGALVGLALGSLGAGGSILTVPALIYLLGFSPAEATTASLIIVIVTSLTALLAHARAKTVRWRAGLLFAAAGLGPAAAAGLLSAHIPAVVLTLAFAALAVLAGLRMLRRRTPSAGATASAPRAAGAGAALGAVTGFLGVGGGFLAVPALVAALAVPMSAAVGTSLLVIIANALVALAARATTEVSLDWALIMPFIATAVLGAWDGKRLAAKVRPATLQRVFGTLLLAVAAVMATGTLL
ncbi:sulfite exporter TauE/SafE family protein [Streptomyces diastaticus]|uniref:sulfite exporter TauE/SafE family protein n=1 Tax=Streptomyces TaxID=1883 RepID=UPI00037AF60B|nr:MULTISPECIES: sulfite exporter TauE/SafE family protein [Streptomyces]KOU70342.1 integral membrane family protein [Streptomyces sp. XY66]WUB68501.1 sulfite exporter TauE/SafE family protein [Streptomyces sp. NBC_00582]